MNHKQKIIATLQSFQDGEHTSYQYEGNWYRKEKTVYILYSENMEEGEVRHFLRYSPNELFVSRKGLIDSEQLYCAGEVRSGYYDNGVMRLALAAQTHQLRCIDAQSHDMDTLPEQLPFSLEWEYELLVDDQSTGRFKVRLDIQEVK